MQSKAGAVMRLLLVDLVGSVVWFPLWWYTTGLSQVMLRAMQALRYRSQSYSLGIWVRNFFVPMYGQHDLTGRIVSVFMRLVVLIGRLIALLVEALVYGLGILLWIVAPALFILLTVNGFIRGAFLDGARSALR